MPDETGNSSGSTIKDATLLKLWYLAFGQKGRLYVGTIPGGLFVSSDGGESFELNRPLWNHESRGGDLFAGEGTGTTHWMGTPASEGGEFAPGIHSVVVDPRNPDRVLVAVSTAGALETTDGGKTWRGRNKGMLNDYLPDPAAEWGHDAHYIELCKGQPDHLWQQNHAGVFYSSDGAKTWSRVSKPEQGVHFGFPVAADDKDGRTAWLVPGRSDNQRMAIDGGLFVARTEDGGESWKQLREGLPQRNAYDVVYRHALDNSGDALAFGSTTGNLYVSENRGDSWQTGHGLLPRAEAHAGEIAQRVARVVGDEDLAGLGRVLAELAGGIDLATPDVAVADAQHVAVADADAQQDLLLWFAPGVDMLTCALHCDRAGELPLRTPEQQEEAVRLALDQRAVVRLHDRQEQLALLVDDLEKVPSAPRTDRRCGGRWQPCPCRVVSAPRSASTAAARWCRDRRRRWACAEPIASGRDGDGRYRYRFSSMASSPPNIG